MTERVDVMIIGGGIAGCSLASELAPGGRVVVLEQEEHLGYHATGRSAALFSETYGNDTVRRLSRASLPFLEAPPAGFAEQPLLRRRGTLYVAAQDRVAQLEAFCHAVETHSPQMKLESGSDARCRAPILRPEMVAAGLFDPNSCDIDVDALHQGFARSAKAHGAQFLTSSRTVRITRCGGDWLVEAGGHRWRTDILVNAAGAWGDEVAESAGVPPLGLRPCRRTAILVDPPNGADIEAWPLVTDIDEQIYFKPDAGMILVSPADETLTHPCDAQPEEWDVAVAADRFMSLTKHEIGRVSRRWAGLRTFTPDRTPAVGFDPSVSRFFWLVGQGGYGVQTAPEIARFAAGLINGRSTSSSCPYRAKLAPDRFRRQPSN